MVERLKMCEECTQRAHCEFFKPGETCFVDEEINSEVYGFAGALVKQMNLKSALQRRMDWGCKSNKRVKKLAKELAEIIRELHEIKEEEKEEEEEECPMISSGYDYGKTQNNL